MKYRYRITSEGTVEADDEGEAEILAVEQVESGAGLVACDVEIELLTGGTEHGHH